MNSYRIEWTKIRTDVRRAPVPPKGIPLEDLVRQMGVARAMRMLPELRQL